MFLRHLSLKNIRSICDLELSFLRGDAPRKWTYLLGENGTGKSSVLRSIALAMAGSHAASELVGDPADWIRLGEDEATIEIEFANARGDVRQSVLTLVRGASPIDFIDRNRQDLAELEAAINHADRNYFIVGYGVTRRPQSARHTFSEGSSIFRAQRARSLATLFSPEVSLISLEQWAMDLDYRKGKEGLAAVKKALDALLPDVKFEGIDRDKRQLQFRTLDGVLPLAALSDGYQAMAGWCGDLLWQITEAFENYKDPLTARGVLLIDEVDIHLHPIWQRQLSSFLEVTLPNFQIVATTHSPLTVHQAGEGELFVLKRDENAGAHLVAYDGAPNRLLLPELIQSPLFGLSSLDSPQVQQLRDELRDLQGVGSEPPVLTTQRKKRIRVIERELRDASNWTDVPPYLKRTNALLERVAAQILPGVEGDPLEAIAAALNPERNSRPQ